jgi:(E)-4-hydroxy-3-methylbut-2-enyl-diphosphate synthase
VYKRSETKKIFAGDVGIGGGAAVAVQSMCNTKTDDIEATVAQIERLQAAGCDIVRLAVPDMDAAKALGKIKDKVRIPIVADIHFDYKLAIEAANAGADKIRINPGNIGSSDKVKAVADICRSKKIPIRIGINAGSLEKGLLEKYGKPTAEAMVESARGHVELLNQYDFDDICLSLKASGVPLTVEAYKLASQEFSYPLHLGVTEAGTAYNGIIKSSVGIGSLLLDGIGDTIRVSLTADPVEEVKAGIAILKAAGIRKDGIRFISCPGCGRCDYDIIATATEVENRLGGIGRDLTVAVMGCAVNGPGEAREADYGVAGGKNGGVIFRRGEIVMRVPTEGLARALIELIESEI